jgi:flagellar biosynthesis/type III secretory pathway protein FliH
VAKKNIKKFLFDVHNFDTPDPDDLMPEVPSFSAAELESAQKAGFDEGLTTALEQSKTLVERDISDKIGLLVARIDELEAAEISREKLFEEEVVSIALKAIEKIFPNLSEAHAYEEVYRYVESVLETQKEVLGKVEIQAAKATIEQLQPRLEAYLEQRGYKTALVFTPKEQLDEKDVVLKWQDGGAEKYFDSTAKRIIETISSFYTQKEADKVNEDEKPLEAEGDTP